MEHGLLIGEVAARSGVSRKALRLYESRGILRPPHRTPSGYRRYPADVLSVLRFVAQARRLGLSLAEIKHVVALRRDGAAPCLHIRTLLEQKAADLERMLDEVRAILHAWGPGRRGPAAVCPHIEQGGGEVGWTSTSSRSARLASTAPRSSSRATRSGSAKRRTSRR
ncbi:MAG TPA: MerR family transcriptional regulator [Nevskiaceae bacterium]|nr:MerR family transcriptional regulator [Nevskiaceae bacterium]